MHPVYVTHPLHLFADSLLHCGYVSLATAVAAHNRPWLSAHYYLIKKHALYPSHNPYTFAPIPNWRVSSPHNTPWGHFQGERQIHRHSDACRLRILTHWPALFNKSWTRVVGHLFCTKTVLDCQQLSKGAFSHHSTNNRIDKQRDNNVRGSTPNFSTQFTGEENKRRPAGNLNKQSLYLSIFVKCYKP